MNYGHPDDPVLSAAADAYDVAMVNYPDPVDWVEQEVGIPWETFRAWAAERFESAIVHGLPPEAIIGLAFAWGWNARKAQEDS